MIRDNKASKTELEESLKNDSLKRNLYLANLLQIFNSTKKHTTYALDGSWGSGKTFFINQLQFISENPQGFININKKLIEDFNAIFSIFYFNAWEHDHQPALESILFELPKMTWDGWEITANQITGLVKNLIDIPIKALSNGATNIDDLKSSYIDRYIKNAKTADEARQEICNLLQNYNERTKKKILFIVDDLDRCRPSYAVELLESIKHCFGCDSAIFLICANNQQLQHTVRKYYGEGFDGYGYLDRFYDLIFKLPEPDLAAYTKYCLKIANPDYVYNSIAIDLAKTLKFSLRQVNRYISDLVLINDFLEGNSLETEGINGLATKNAFIQIAAALKIVDPEKFNRFITGNGVDIIKDLASKSEELGVLNMSFGSRVNTSNALILCYNELFRGNSIKAYRSAEAFRRAVTSMGFSTVVDEE